MVDEIKKGKSQKLRVIFSVAGKGRREICIFLEQWEVFTEPSFRKLMHANFWGILAFRSDPHYGSSTTDWG